MIRNTSGQTVGVQMVDATTGGAFVGAVTVSITGDGDTQTLGSVGSGLCTAEGNGYYTYQPAALETDYNLVAFTFTGTGAITKTVQYETLTTAQATALSAASLPGSITALSLITKALRRIGVVGAGQTPSDEDAADGLDLLNSLLDSFATERLLVPSITRFVWTIEAGVSTYTVGTGGDLDMARPVFLENIRFQDTAQSPTLEMPLSPLTDQSYARLGMKSLTAPFPYAVYYNPTYSGAGFGTITLYPTPTSSTLQGVIYAPAALTEVDSLTRTLLLQPGYRWFLQETLAVMAAPEFGVPVPPELRASAMEAKANIKRANIRVVELATSEGAYFGGRGGYNIWSDS